MYRHLAIVVATLFLTQCSQEPEAPLTMKDLKGKIPPPPEGIFAEGEDWELVVGGMFYADGPAIDKDGNLFYSTIPTSLINRIDNSGKETNFEPFSMQTLGMVFGPDERLYACRNGESSIVVYDMDGQFEVLHAGEGAPVEGFPGAETEFCNDLVVRSNGDIYFTDRAKELITLIPANGEARIVWDQLRPNGIALFEDEKRLVAGDSRQPRVVAFQIEDNGDLTEIKDYYEPIFYVEVPSRGVTIPGINGMTIDTDGRLYVTSFFGIQVFDRDGKNIGIIRAPGPYSSNMTFGGADLSTLYVTGTMGIYKRILQTKGVPRPAQIASGDSPETN